MSWLLIQLREICPNVHVQLALWHAIAFAFILVSLVVMFFLKGSVSKLSKRVFIGLVVVDFVLMFWLAVALGKSISTCKLDPWHVGAMMMVVYLAIGMLSAMYEISTSIRELRSLR